MYVTVYRQLNVSDDNVDPDQMQQNGLGSAIAPNKALFPTKKSLYFSSAQLKGLNLLSTHNRCVCTG